MRHIFKLIEMVISWAYACGTRRIDAPYDATIEAYRYGHAGKNEDTHVGVFIVKY